MSFALRQFGFAALPQLRQWAAAGAERGLATAVTQMALIKELREKSGAPISDVKVTALKQSVLP